MEENKLEIEEIKAKIYGGFSTCSQLDVNFAMAVLELILEQKSEIQSKLMQYVCELWATIKSSEELEVPERISTAKYEKMKSLYGEAVDAALLAYTRKGLMEGWDREQFYSHLWEFVSTNIMWSSMEEKAFALYYIAIDARTPYYNVGAGLRMSNDDYSKIQNEIFEASREFRFIIALDFPQRTEEASLLLNLINRMDTEEQKIVLLSRIIAYYKDRIDKIIDQVKNG
ncbi:MAG: hypothetical protein NC548_03250 [Lachnospiraceae bacterium]|nr:hypothetical protein [Lachnospiraceae bacterium]